MLVVKNQQHQSVKYCDASGVWKLPQPNWEHWKAVSGNQAGELMMITGIGLGLRGTFTLESLHLLADSADEPVLCRSFNCYEKSWGNQQGRAVWRTERLHHSPLWRAA